MGHGLKGTETAWSCSSLILMRSFFFLIAEELIWIAIKEVIWDSPPIKSYFIMSLKATILSIWGGSRGILFFDCMPISFHFSQKKKKRTLYQISPGFFLQLIKSLSSLILDLKVSSWDWILRSVTLKREEMWGTASSQISKCGRDILELDVAL